MVENAERFHWEKALLSPPHKRAAVQDKQRWPTMPYGDNRDLPGDVKDALPEYAQDIYREAYNNAWDEYEDPDDRRGDESREAAAHRVAWSAVTQKYEKGDDGKWHKKD
jgi:cation transport regulator